MEKRDINKRLNAIYNHFGKDISENKLYEELLELLEAIDSGVQKDIINEKSDVFCLLMQHYLSSKAIQKKVVEKVERTEDRIKTGYYEERL
jgi:phosphoribosyl-ATP pyrophosphohydrolase